MNSDSGISSLKGEFEINRKTFDSNELRKHSSQQKTIIIIIRLSLKIFYSNHVEFALGRIYYFCNI